MVEPVDPRNQKIFTGKDLMPTDILNGAPDIFDPAL